MPTRAEAVRSKSEEGNARPGVPTRGLIWLCRAAVAGWGLLLLLPLCGCAKKEARAVAPTPEVEVASVAQQDVPIYGEWIAVLDGYVNAQIQPQVTGYLMKQNYQEGTLVKRGDVLFEIDPRPFEAALAQVKGQLAQAEAQLGKTRLDVERDTPLARERAIPQAQLDNDIQANEAAKAVVLAAQAQVEQAQLNVGFTRVRSLVDGLAGLAKGQIGDLVGPNTELTTVSQVNPIKAYVSISEQEYLQSASKINAAARGKDAAALSAKTLELVLADGSTYPRKGWFVFADRQVDLKTGTIRVAAAFENPESLLRPGQFARVRLPVRLAAGALLVPERAVVETQGSYSVVVVGTDNKASIRPVKVGERVGQKWIIAAGVNAGEQVIVEGMQKVREGAPVNPRQSNGKGEGE